MNKRILITGGAGFIGSHLVDTLLTDGWNVYVIDNFNSDYSRKVKKYNLKEALKHENFHLSEGDITDKDFVFETVQTFQPEYVVHLAAKSGVGLSLKEPEIFTETNLVGTVNIFEALKAAHTHVKNFIFASSAWVYGNNEKLPFYERDQVEKQNSPYAITKRSGELLCKMYAELENFPTACLRFFTVYGPRQRPELAMNVFLSRALAGKPLSLYGDTSVTRDYVHVQDAVGSIVAALNNPKPFEIYNIGSGTEVSLKDLVKIIEDIVGNEVSIKAVPAQSQDIPRMRADISKAKRELDWKPTVDFKQGMKEMVKWVKETSHS